jgi:hypothetical protein
LAGLVKEIEAKASAPIWRRDSETGQAYALKLTATGIQAIGIDEGVEPGRWLAGAFWSANEF